MRWKQTDKGLLIVLAKGEEVMSSLVAVCDEVGVTAGTAQFIGAIRDPVLGYYNVDEKKYTRRQFSGSYELVGFSGTITAHKEGGVFLHAHVALSGPDFSVVAGHLFEARVSATVEGVVAPLPLTVNRVLDSDVGLALMDLDSIK